MIDKLVEVGSMADWITPVYGWIMNWVHRPARQMVLGLDVTTPIEVQQILSDRGIRTWAYQIVGRKFVFGLRAAQYRHAEYWLKRYGIVG